MTGIEEILCFLLERDDLKIRSEIIPINEVGSFEFDASIIKPYSFLIVNTGNQDMFINGKLALEKMGGNHDSLDFPRVGTFKRNDIITLRSSNGVLLISGFIRADLELTG